MLRIFIRARRSGVDRFLGMEEASGSIPDVSTEHFYNSLVSRLDALSDGKATGLFGSPGHLYRKLKAFILYEASIFRVAFCPVRFTIVKIVD